MFRRCAISRCPGWKRSQTTSITAEGRPVAMSGTGFKLDPMRFGFNNHVVTLRWYGVMDDGRERFRFEVSGMLDGTVGGMDKRNFWVDCSLLSVSLYHQTGDTIVFAGLSPDHKASIMYAREFGYGPISYLEMMTRHTKIRVFSVNCGLRFGMREFVSGMLVPSGIEAKKLSYVSRSKNANEFVTRVFLVPIFIFAMIFTMAGMSTLYMVNSTLCDDSQAREDARALLAEARKERAVGNEATATHITMLLDELLALKRGADADEISAIHEVRKKLEDPASDRFRIAMGLTCEEPLFRLPTEPVKKQEETSVADAIAARVRQVQKLKEEQR
eukprot:TRINITY_DN4414_c0_g1_i1.p1 TRINITY_DN4414_c0_g1~~TRINITY_DN4414_c0_g1_i1.p1  ORF type:complete len:330 (+),score=59.70 TRINITY_DN4414_c0_g1_i1:448-1437(+)